MNNKEKLSESSLFLEFKKDSFDTVVNFLKRFNKSYVSELEKDLTQVKKELLRITTIDSTKFNTAMLMSSTLRNHLFDIHLIDVIIGDHFSEKDNLISSDIKEIIDICEHLFADSDKEISNMISRNPLMLKTMQDYKRRCHNEAKEEIKKLETNLKK